MIEGAGRNTEPTGHNSSIHFEGNLNAARPAGVGLLILAKLKTGLNFFQKY